MEIELISFYSPETDIIVEIDLYGGKGAGIFGGRGGYSRIILSMIKNTEYVIVGLGHYSTINTPFIYKKSKLIACVGSGGAMGTSNAVGIGAGGAGLGAIPTVLSPNGIFGSATNLTPIDPDTKAAAPNGGRVLPYTKGVYWRQQGLSASEDIPENTQFRLSNGTIVKNTASIARGFKAGYGINETSGQGSFGGFGANGGSGAIGGKGGTDGSGGEGGRGYTDGSVTVITNEPPTATIQSNAIVVMRLSAGPEIIQSGLLLALDAGNSKSYPGFGNTWADLSGNGNNGTLVNGPTYSSADGGSLVFDGVMPPGKGVQLPGTNLSLNQMTISSWNYSSNYNQNGFMFEKTINGTVNTQYSLFYNGNNLIYYRTYGLSTTDLTVNTSTAGVVNNQWNNVVATWDGTNKRIYVNGILRVTSTNLTGTVTQNTTGAAYIGIYGNFAGYPFNGRISKTSIYNRALTLGEIQQNFNALKSRFSIN